jgi:hypothetical protein
MTDQLIRIDRLAIEASGLSAEEGRRLALAIAAGLTESGVPLTGHISAMRVSVAKPDGAAPHDVAQRAVADVLRQLRRNL